MFSLSAHNRRMDKRELWKMFEKTGDVEWYAMYCSMRDEEGDKRK